MPIRIVVVGGPLDGQKFEFGADKTSISFGRFPDRDVRFPADLKAVSRAHFTIVQENHKYYLRPDEPVFVDGHEGLRDDALPANCELALGTKDGKIELTFAGPDGARTESVDAAIVTVPFTKLREVKGLESLDLGEEKMKCIQELGYGTNAKVINGTTSRVWRSDASGLPAPSNGAFYADVGFQTLWEESRAQPGDAGIITDFLGGKAGLAEENAALETFRTGVAKMSPKMAESLDKAAIAFFFWARYPFTLGSYASAKPGQYTTLLDVAAEPALDGKVQFAGEHTSVDFLGYMNGGVESGNRAAAALVETLELKG